VVVGWVLLGNGWRQRGSASDSVAAVGLSMWGGEEKSRSLAPRPVRSLAGKGNASGEQQSGTVWTVEALFVSLCQR